MSKTKENTYLELIKIHEKIIHKVVGLYHSDDNDKEDMYQEILLQVWRGIDNFKNDAKFSTWLYKVALNTVLNGQKQKRIETETLSESQPQESSENYDNINLLYQVIRRLDEIDRMIITLNLEGYKNPEIEEITGMSTNHINVKLHRIRKSITDQLKVII